MGKGSGFGKVILFGEHFVVHGVPGIVSAIDSTNDAEVRKTTKGITVRDVRKAAKGYAEEKRAQQLESIDRILKAMGMEPKKVAFDIFLGGNLPGFSGLGASAASSVAPFHQLDRASSRITMAAGLAILVTPQVLGTLADQIDIKNAYAVAAGFLILAAGMALFANRLALPPDQDENRPG